MFDGRELPARTPASITTVPGLLHELAQIRELAGGVFGQASRQTCPTLVKTPNW